MASTFVNDLRLNEQATGDNSGSWGTVTNTNLELIAEAFSFGTEAITTNADTHTTTIADGGTDPGRSMFLKYTGTLDSACTITIGPNTVSKLWFIENGTSGSQNIIIKQGSGATITIPPGDTKAIYSDGAGSGAAMVDAFASLSVVDLKVQDDLTVTDDATIGGTALVTGVLTTTAAAVFNGGFTSNADTNTFTSANSTDPRVVIENKTNDANAAVLNFVKDKGAAGADDDSIGSIFFTGDNTAQEQILFARINGVVETAADGQEGGRIQLQVANHDGGMGTGLSVFDGDANNEIDVNIALGNASTTTIAGNATVTSDLSVTGVTLVRNGSVSAPAIGNTGDSNTGMFFPADNEIAFTEGGVERVRIDANGRVLIGLQSAEAVAGVTSHLQLAGTTANTSGIGTICYSNDGIPPIFMFGKSRSGTIGTEGTIVVDGDNIGNINWGADDGTNMAPNLARISGQIDGSPSEDDMPGRLVFSTAADGTQTISEKMRITSSGLVNIGESVESGSAGVPAKKLNVVGGLSTVYSGSSVATWTGIQVGNSTNSSNRTATGLTFFHRTSSSGIAAIQSTSAAADRADLRFVTRGSAGISQKMMISDDGNVLVAKTTTAIGTVGHAFMATGQVNHVRAGNTPLFVNRQSSNGPTIAIFLENVEEGNIGTEDGRLYIESSGAANLTGIGFSRTDAALEPRKNGTWADNAMDVGSSTYRFDDVFATNGTIQTSDRNEKQDIAALTSAEMLVAKRISVLFKTFRWKDKVATKGDDARTHSGIVAQDVQAAFEAESLDAGDYSMFISNTWWEHDVDVAAVEADDTVEPAIEAKDAYTRTDPYMLESEAPSGSTKKTRLGIRYPELLSFLAGYNEQRFVAIETRLTALEG